MVQTLLVISENPAHSSARLNQLRSKKLPVMTRTHTFHAIGLHVTSSSCHNRRSKVAMKSCNLYARPLLDLIGQPPHERNGTVNLMSLELVLDDEVT